MLTFDPTCLCYVPFLTDPALPSNFTSEAIWYCNDNGLVSKPQKVYYLRHYICLGENMYKQVHSASIGATDVK